MKKETSPLSIDLSSRQRRELRARAHHFKPVVLVGREGISASLLDSVDKALTARELIKIRLGQNCPVQKKEAAEQLARRSRAALVQLIGRTVLLYRPRPEEQGEENG